MAYGDTRRRPGRGGGWGSSQTYYDDEGRGASKNIWEWFEETYERSGYTDSWLVSIDDQYCYRLLRDSTQRFGLEDIAPIFLPEQYDTDDADRKRWTVYVMAIDSRARRLIKSKSPNKDAAWMPFYKHTIDGYRAWKLRDQEERRKRDEEGREEMERVRQQREAQAAKLKREAMDAMTKTTDLISGALRSDFNSAFTAYELHSQTQGDYLDDVVDGYTTGTGFIDEVRRPGGIKLQITLTLDLSNSMYNNGIWLDAANAFRDMGLALKQAKLEFPNELYTGFFFYSLDAGSEDSQVGKRAGRLWRYDMTQRDEFDLVEFQDYHPLNISSYLFDGEDTWIYPLFEAIENWELKESLPGAARLDIIITDAVLEHVSDIRKADEIQERRNGNLQTVMLNFMKPEHWTDGTLPKRCVQYYAHPDNIDGLLRQIIAEFISVNL